MSLVCFIAWKKSLKKTINLDPLRSKFFFEDSLNEFIYNINMSDNLIFYIIVWIMTKIMKSDKVNPFKCLSQAVVPETSEECCTPAPKTRCYHLLPDSKEPWSGELPEWMSQAYQIPASQYYNQCFWNLKNIVWHFGWQSSKSCRTDAETVNKTDRLK